MADDKYTHLLQPIRDLAANWNINIANELAEYLEVLENLTFSFKGGHSLNFAEAALVIQGSACVYSKKVEYLHSLVYQALEFVAERKVKALRTKGGADKDGEQDDEFDDEEHFLSLDDGLEEGTGIDLDDQLLDDEGYDLLPTRLPSTLLALEDTGMGHGDGDAGNYRIASCAVHHSGALLLEVRDGFHLDDQLRPVAAASRCAPALQGRANLSDAEMASTDPYGDYNDDNDYGDMGGDYDMDTMEAGAGGNSPAEHEMTQHHGFNNAAATAAPGTHSTRAGGRMEDEGDEEEELFDPYKPLDPNDAGSLASKPFKKASKVARKPKVRPVPQSGTPGALLESLLTRPAPNSALLLPEFEYAQHQADVAFGSRRPGSAAIGGRSRQGVTRQLATVFTLDDATAAADMAQEADTHDAEENNTFGEVYGEEYDGGDYAGPDDDFEDIAELATADQWTDAARAAAMGNGNSYGGSYNELHADGEDITYEELCRAHVEAYINAAAAAEVQTELASRVSGWRSKMAPVLEEEESRPEFDIHVYGERVLDGLAALSVSGSATTVNDQGEKKKQAAASTSSGGAGGEVLEVAFGDVVSRAQVEQPYDVPRTFSSMLQLVNNGNLRITKLGGSNQDFTVTLLNTTMAHRKFSEYKAPSSKVVDAEGEQEDADMFLAEPVMKPAATKTTKRRKAA